MQQTYNDSTKLIQFFSKNKADYIKTPEGKEELMVLFDATTWRALTRMPEYNQHFATIQKLRDDLDSAIKGTKDKNQVQSCLALLRKKKNQGFSDELDILWKWIKLPDPKGIYNGWEPTLKAYFDDAYQVIFKWKDFFFSYTNRSAIQTNNDFKNVIIHSLGEEEFQSAIKGNEKTNLLAKLLVGCLAQESLKPFFDVKEMKCGDDIEDKVLAHCKSSYVFVQLLESAVFSEPEKDKKNWCHCEFKAFDDWVEKTLNNFNRHFFIFTHNREFVLPAQRNEQYDLWRDKIERLKYLTILDGLSNFEIRVKMKELASEIVRTKTQILEHYLGDFFNPKMG